jgi:hypothetical protein
MLQEYYESVGSQLSEDGDGWRPRIQRRILQGRGKGINWVAAWKIDLGAVAQGKAFCKHLYKRWVSNTMFVTHFVP